MYHRVATFDQIVCFVLAQVIRFEVLDQLGAHHIVAELRREIWRRPDPFLDFALEWMLGHLGAG